jgi:type II secretory pathway component GspD/PulD (secretin)
MVFAVLVGLFGLIVQGGQAQDASTVKGKRMLYSVKHGDAGDLATVLGKLFKGDAEIQSLPGSPSNCLLVRAEPKVLEEIAKVLAEVDRRPRLVSVELIIAERPLKAATDEKPIDAKDFTGAAKEVLARVEAHKKKGDFTGVKRFQFLALENRPARFAAGESMPYTSGAFGGGRPGARVSRALSYRDIGTTADVTARIQDDKTVVLDLSIQHSRAHVPEDGIVVGQEENGVPIRATEFFQDLLKSKLSVTSGQAVAARDIQTSLKTGRSRTTFIVTARILGPEVEPGK